MKNIRILLLGIFFSVFTSIASAADMISGTVGFVGGASWTNTNTILEPTGQVTFSSFAIALTTSGNFDELGPPPINTQFSAVDYSVGSIINPGIVWALTGINSTAASFTMTGGTVHIDLDPDTAAETLIIRATGVLNLTDYEETAGTFDFSSETGYGVFSAGSTAVPLPAAAWLFGSGLIALVGIGRRRKVAA